MDEVSAYLVDASGDRSDLAEKIAEKILNVFSDLEKAEKIGVEGRTVALKCFDWRVYSLPLNEWLADV